MEICHTVGKSTVEIAGYSERTVSVGVVLAQKLQIVCTMTTTLGVLLVYLLRRSLSESLEYFTTSKFIYFIKKYPLRLFIVTNTFDI